MTYKELKDYIAPYRTRMLATLAILIGLVIGEVVLTCLIPAWRSYFYTILQFKQQHLFMQSILYLSMLLSVLVIMQCLKGWIGQLFSYKLRTVIVDYFHSFWEKTKHEPLNFGQGLTGSVMSATTQFTRICTESFIALSIVCVLIYTNRHDWLLLGVAAGYTVALGIGTWLFYEPTVTRNMHQQEAYGEYRDYLTNKEAQHKSFYRICENFTQSYYKLIKLSFGFQVFGGLGGAFANIVPYLFLSHAYFTGHITLGYFMSTVATFELIVLNSTVMLALFPQITDSFSSWKILKRLDFDFKTYYTKSKDNIKGERHE